MRLGKYAKSSGSRKRYTISYSDWLDEDELVQSGSFDIVNQTSEDLLVVDTITVLPSGTGLQFYVSGGLLDVLYEVVVTMETTQTQIAEDSIIYSIKEP